MFFTEEEKTTVFTVHKTVMSMLRDRGYMVEDAEINLTRADFIAKYGDRVTRENLEMQKEMHNDSSNKIMIFYPNDSKIGVKNIRGCLQRMKAEDITRGILILQKKLAPQARACIAAASSLYLIDVFEEAELLFNIKEHELVPAHQLLTTEEKKRLLEKYTVKESQLPRIFVNDPVAKYYGLRRGQVVRITRESGTAGDYVTYRYVV
ncbi:unnamed protein product [Cuscuta epithymum]|uniref:DNA-directed RNA polymerases I, II, and III subunit RPABC1 n=1 Tax=Cuscuta epithymum TaxID=186058 RepID=A0AAV0DSW9_9ASTE|nr:unnamed protein product [Cuscuta epithymum]